MDRGVYWPCSQFEALFVSSQHDDHLIDLTLEAADEALAELG
jgi:glutamate-1-semialdehyde 2,1-aminomutase